MIRLISRTSKQLFIDSDIIISKIKSDTSQYKKWISHPDGHRASNAHPPVGSDTHSAISSHSIMGYNLGGKGNGKHNQKGQYHQQPYYVPHQQGSRSFQQTAPQDFGLGQMAQNFEAMLSSAKSLSTMSQLGSLFSQQGISGATPSTPTQQGRPAEELIQSLTEVIAKSYEGKSPSTSGGKVDSRMAQTVAELHEAITKNPSTGQAQSSSSNEMEKLRKDMQNQITNLQDQVNSHSKDISVIRAEVGTVFSEIKQILGAMQQNKPMGMSPGASGKSDTSEVCLVGKIISKLSS